jgi:hypothetical protein
VHPLDILAHFGGFNFFKWQDLFPSLVYVPNYDYLVVGARGKDVPVDIVPRKSISFRLMPEKLHFAIVKFGLLVIHVIKVELRR